MYGMIYCCRVKRSDFRLNVASIGRGGPLLCAARLHPPQTPPSPSAGTALQHGAAATHQVRRIDRPSSRGTESGADEGAIERRATRARGRTRPCRCDVCVRHSLTHMPASIACRSSLCQIKTLVKPLANQLKSHAINPGLIREVRGGGARPYSRRAHCGAFISSLGTIRLTRTRAHCRVRSDVHSSSACSPVQSCLRYGRFHHRVESRASMRLAGHPNSWVVKPLVEETAVNLGATVLSELFIFSIAGIVSARGDDRAAQQ
jgi:hypothetical protein